MIRHVFPLSTLIFQTVFMCAVWSWREFFQPRTVNNHCDGSGSRCHNVMRREKCVRHRSRLFFSSDRVRDEFPHAEMLETRWWINAAFIIQWEKKKWLINYGQIFFFLDTTKTKLNDHQLLFRHVCQLTTTLHGSKWKIIIILFKYKDVANFLMLQRSEIYYFLFYLDFLFYFIDSESKNTYIYICLSNVNKCFSSCWRWNRRPGGSGGYRVK